jgi:hypothetical protein
VSIHDVLPLLRDYNRYKELFRPGVIASHPLTLSDSEDRFSLVLANQSLFARSAVESDYKSTHVRVDDRRRYIVTQSTRVQEIADYGTSGQHTLPEGEGLGLLWRMFGITRLEERDGGVYVELEAIALSRDVPRGLRWLAEPIVRRVARTSLTQSLRQTRDAVEANRTLPAGAAAGR